MTENAYGFLEIKGLVAGIVAADAMVKSAAVRLVAQIETRPGLITLVVEGDLGACSAAIEAGHAAALTVGEVLSQKVMGRPDPSIAIFFERSTPSMHSTLALDSVTPLLDLLKTMPKGLTLKRISSFLQISIAHTKRCLDDCIAQGLVTKKHHHYLVIKQEQHEHHQ